MVLKREIFGPHPRSFAWGADYREPNWSQQEYEFVRTRYPYPCAQHAIEWFNDRLADGTFNKWRLEREAA